MAAVRGFQTRRTADPRRSYPTRLMLFGAFAVLATLVPLTSAARPLTLATNAAPTGTFGNGTVLPNGRLVTPAGRTYDLGDFPLGGAVSPDGRLAVATNNGYGTGQFTGTGGFCGHMENASCPLVEPTPAAGAAAYQPPDESLTVTDLRTGRQRTITAVPTAKHYNYFYVGVAFSPDGRHLYASGGGNDALYDFPVRRDVVAPRPVRTIILPITQATSAQGAGYTKGLTVTPNGRYVLVAHELNNTLDIVDTKSGAVTQVTLAAASYPYAVAVSADSATAYVSLQGLGEVAQVALSGSTSTLTRVIGVGDHPTGLALAPDGTRLYVANADDDTLSVIDTASNAVVRSIPLHVFDQEQLGSSPDAVAVSPDGQRVYVALAGDDAVAVLGTQKSFDSGATGSGPRGTASPAAADLLVGGVIPTAWYPASVSVSPDGRHVYIVSAKGLGSRYPGTALGAALVSSRYSQKNNMYGVLQSVTAPAQAALTAGLATARQDIAFAANTDGRSPNNPVPAAPISGTTAMTSPIKYVIEIVRENRTFDEQLGDLGKDEGRPAPGAPNPTGADTLDGTPGYAIFGRDVTPQGHALTGDPISTTSAGPSTAYATSDNFYSDGEASVQGHYWTAEANVNDYVEKSWRMYYSPRAHPSDTISSVSSLRNCSIFQSAIAKGLATNGAFTYRDYGELLGVANPSLSAPVAPGTGVQAPTVPSLCAAVPATNFDATGSNNATLVTDNRPTAAAFVSSIGLNPDGTTSISGTTPGLSSQYFLRNFSYVIMGGDHTNGLSSTNSPRALLAENDAGLGMIVRALSHSKYWSQTAIFVMEDDSQDGIDHVDGHRNLLYVVSPWTKHVGPDGKPGYIGHLHYSQASVMKTMELILGLPYLSTYDQHATALYDLFQDKNDPAQLTAQDMGGYTMQPDPPFINETSAQVLAGMGPAADVPYAESKRLDLSAIDRAGPLLEIVNWQLARPGQPVPAQLTAELQVWNAKHGKGERD